MYLAITRQFAEAFLDLRLDDDSYRNAISNLSDAGTAAAPGEPACGQLPGFQYQMALDQTRLYYSAARLRSRLSSTRSPGRSSSGPGRTGFQRTADPWNGRWRVSGRRGLPALYLIRHVGGARVRGAPGQWRQRTALPDRAVGTGASGLYLDHWGKPLFTLLASPFAQLGFAGMKAFNALCMLGVAADHAAGPPLGLPPCARRPVAPGLPGRLGTDVLGPHRAAVRARPGDVVVWPKRIAGGPAALVAGLSPSRSLRACSCSEVLVCFLVLHRQWRAIPGRPPGVCSSVSQAGRCMAPRSGPSPAFPTHKVPRGTAAG